MQPGRSGGGYCTWSITVLWWFPAITSPSMMVVLFTSYMDGLIVIRLNF